jgi:hypothetical protein
MDITIRIYTKSIRGYEDTKTILLNEGELDDAIESYLYREEYLQQDVELTGLSYEGVSL